MWWILGITHVLMNLLSLLSTLHNHMAVILRMHPVFQTGLLLLVEATLIPRTPRRCRLVLRLRSGPALRWHLLRGRRLLDMNVATVAKVSLDPVV